MLRTSANFDMLSCISQRRKSITVSPAPPCPQLPNLCSLQASLHPAPSSPEAALSPTCTSLSLWQSPNLSCLAFSIETQLWLGGTSDLISVAKYLMREILYLDCCKTSVVKMLIPESALLDQQKPVLRQKRARSTGRKVFNGTRVKFPLLIQVPEGLNISK